MSNIKEEIGKRILDARKSKGLTRKALAELTDDLNASRINNWEHGTRTPGPKEIMQLAKALEIDSSYLMCLSDNKQSNIQPDLPALIPILSYKQICDFEKSIHNLKAIKNGLENDFLPITNTLAAELGQSAFALKLTDDSMEPELRMHDLLLIDPDAVLRPGGLVVAILENENIFVVRKYKQLLSSNQEFVLTAINENWAPIKGFIGNGLKLIGSVKAVFRMFY